MAAYYNELDPYAAQWLRNLIAAGLIAPGDVDERDIRDVMPAELKGYTQCHFFAGIGVWSYALRRAGWPDDRPVWTGSCPCQPFSAAGRKGGFTDERHLWPAWHHLISVRRPPVIFGEQVASKDGLGWLDLVQADLEGANYASAAADLCAAGVGAPHIRQRLWFVAERLGDADHPGLEGRRRVSERTDQLASGPGGMVGGMANADCGPGEQGGEVHGRRDPGSNEDTRCRSGGDIQSGFMADTSSVSDQRKADAANHERPQAERPTSGAGRCGSAFDGLADACSQRQHRINALLRAEKSGRQQAALSETARCSEANRECCAGPVNGFWSDADWIFCRDGKWRPVVASHVALADGPATGMVRMCAEGTDKKGVTYVELQKLRYTACSKEVQQRRSGEPFNARKTKILRPEMHGGRDAEKNLQERQPQQDEGISKSERKLRALREKREAARAPRGRESVQQRAQQLDDIVPLLSPSLSLAEFYGNHRAAGELRALQRAIHEAGAVCDPSIPAQTAWASLGEEAADQIRLDFDATRWEIVVASPLEQAGDRSRQGRLKAYGNAIVAEVAATVVAGYMDTEKRTSNGMEQI